MILLSRRTVVMTGILVSVISLALGRADWVTARSTGLSGAESGVSVIGSAAAPATIGLAVVALAASLATTISSSVIRWVTGPVIGLAGIGLGMSAISVMTDPAGAAASGVAEATGVRGGTTQVTLSAWPAVSLVPAVALLALGVMIVLSGARWSDRTRYRRAADERPDAAPRTEDEVAEDPAAMWDALSRGDDPTEQDPRGPRPTEDVAE